MRNNFRAVHRYGAVHTTCTALCAMTYRLYRRLLSFYATTREPIAVISNYKIRCFCVLTETSIWVILTNSIIAVPNIILVRSSFNFTFEEFPLYLRKWRTSARMSAVSWGRSLHKPHPLLPVSISTHSKEASLLAYRSPVGNTMFWKHGFIISSIHWKRKKKNKQIKKSSWSNPAFVPDFQHKHLLAQACQHEYIHMVDEALPEMKVRKFQ